MQVRILVVDDNRDTLRAYVKALLRKVNLNNWDSPFRIKARDTTPEVIVEEADTVSQAIEKLRIQTFEILVVDLKIPGSFGEEMGGLEIISESLSLDPLRPVISITGYGTIQLIKETYSKGIFDFIEKSSTAIDDLVNSVQRAIDHRFQKIFRSGNPFRPAAGSEPTVLGGRLEEIEFFCQKLDRAIHGEICENFLILGSWGIGKSALLREFKKIGQSRGHLTAYVPLEPLPLRATTIEAARSIVEGVIRDLPYSFDRFKKLKTYFSSIGITVVGTGIQFARDTSKDELSAQSFLHDTLLRLWRDLKNEIKVLTILLDDFDNFVSVSEILMTIRSVFLMESIQKSKILIGLAMTPKSWYRVTETDTHHPLSRLFIRRTELGPLQEEEVRDTIIRSLRETGVSFANEIVTRVFKYTKGHPFEMQVLCYHLFNNQINWRVETDVWEKALQTALSDLGAVEFEHWFRQASRDEAKVLSFIASKDQPVSSTEIRALAKRKKIKAPANNAPKYLQSLLEKGLIKKSDRGLFQIRDRMFGAYVLTR